MCFLFFFSSRRRHTRYWRDWSSDVCSSDLEKVSKDIPEQAKKDIQNAKVQIKENVVNGTIVLNQELNQVQLDKIAETYGKTLSEKYKDKEIKVKVVHKNQVASDFSTSNINVGKGIPKAQVEIAPGVVMSK